MNKTHLIGIMSGTSLDAIDAVILSSHNAEYQLTQTLSLPFPSTLKTRLLELINHNQPGLLETRQLHIELGHAYANATNQLLQQSDLTAQDIRCIGCHGQTLFHHPNQHPGFSIQIGDGNTIAALTQITTVTDFRQRDICLGGQGAPLAPAFHRTLIPEHTPNCCFINIGGISNITFLPSTYRTPISGHDIGPGNVLLDSWCSTHLKTPYDKDGQWASSANPDNTLLQRLLSDAYFSKPAPKSTGRDYFNPCWLEQALTLCPNLPPVVVQSTLTELTAVTIANAINNTPQRCDTAWLCGGGAFNSFLRQRIQAHCDHTRITTTSELNIDPQWIEACAFAWLAERTLLKQPGNQPSVTGANKATILGAIHPALAIKPTLS